MKTKFKQGPGLIKPSGFKPGAITTIEVIPSKGRALVELSDIVTGSLEIIVLHNGSLELMVSNCKIDHVRAVASSTHATLYRSDLRHIRSDGDLYITSGDSVDLGELRVGGALRTVADLDVGSMYFTHNHGTLVRQSLRCLSLRGSRIVSSAALQSDWHGELGRTLRGYRCANYKRYFQCGCFFGTGEELRKYIMDDSVHGNDVRRTRLAAYNLVNAAINRNHK